MSDAFSAMIFDKDSFVPHDDRITMESASISNRVPDIKDDPPPEYKAATAIKHDANKPDLTLLPRVALWEEARAMMHGEKKYGRDNYRKGEGLAWHRLAAAAERHITAWVDGEDYDTESGLSHLAHARAALGMLMQLIEDHKGEDCR